MKRQELIKLVDLLSFLALLSMVSTGLLLEFTLPPRSGGDTVWAATRHQWGSLHFWVSITFLALMTTHLLLHLKFIKSALLGKADREHNYRIAVGIMGLVALLLLAAMPVLSPVEPGAKAERHRQHAVDRQQD